MPRLGTLPIVVAASWFAFVGSSTADAQGGGANGGAARPGTVTPPVTPVTPGAGGTTPVAPGTGAANGGAAGNNGGANAGRIVVATGVLVGDTVQATAVAGNQVAAAPAAGGAAAVAANATYAWSITGGRILGSTTNAVVNYVADAPGTVTLTVAITSNGATSTLTSNVTAISSATAGTINAPATAAAVTAPDTTTITASVPAAENGDRTFRWTVSGDAAITSGQGTASINVRPGGPGVKEITCLVNLQSLVTVSLRSYLVVTGDGPPVALTINNGTGTGTYPANSRVDIFANPPGVGQVFDRWTGDVSVFGANANLAPFVPHLVLAVPTTPVTLTAIYKAAPAWTPSVATNFNPQTQPVAPGATAPATPTTLTTTLRYYVPNNAGALVFLVHENGSGSNAWFNTPEGALLTRDLVAAGYGVAALDSINRNNGIWSAQTALASNLDALNHSAALAKITQETGLAAGKPVFLLGLGTGADTALRFADLLSNASPAMPVRGVVLYCSAGNEVLAVTSRLPQFFVLTANDEVLGATGNTTARDNSQLLAGRGLATGSFTNAVSPVHANRFRALGVTAASFTATDATAVWNAVKGAGYLDANNYPKSIPTVAALATALPETYRSRAADVVAQLAVASANQEFFSDANSRVIAFLNGRVAGTPAPAAGRMINLSSRSKISYVDDSFNLGFNIAGPDRATLLIRGIGPGLVKYGVTNAILAPRLEVNDGSGKLIATNERWDAPGGTATAAQISTAAASVGAFALNPGDNDAAVLLTNLAPGSYTATIKGVNGASGDVLAEVYDVSKNNTRLTNLSTLAKIASEGDVLIPGIAIQGNAPRTLVVRAVGVGLTDYGVPADAVLSDPRISVLSGSTTVDTNNNWTQGSAATLTAVFPAVGAFPLKTTNPSDAALVTSIAAGNYTLRAEAAPAPANAPAGTRAADPTGIVLVEVYEVP